VTTDERESYWDAVYAAREDTALTWFEETPELSLRLIEEHAGPYDPVIDVGGGASRLVGLLIGRQFTRITCLDLSGAALATSQGRLGDAAERVTWIAADVTTWRADAGAYAAWHDRAAFHFLTEAAQREAYVANMVRGVRPGGHAILMTFAEDGPERCSGLPVHRYSPESLGSEIGRHAPGAFSRVSASRFLHRTPKGAEQAFQVSVLRRT